MKNDMASFANSNNAKPIVLCVPEMVMVLYRWIAAFAQLHICRLQNTTFYGVINSISRFSLFCVSGAVRELLQLTFVRFLMGSRPLFSIFATPKFRNSFAVYGATFRGLLIDSNGGNCAFFALRSKAIAKPVAFVEIVYNLWHPMRRTSRPRADF